jgi:hypothetical protein
MTRPTLAVVLSLVLLPAATATAQQASELYQRALVQEHAEGNLPDAIALYRQAAQAAGPDRALAARALLRAARSYETLGQRGEAGNMYAELIRMYPDQRTEMALAQERLTALQPRTPATESRTGTASAIEVASVTPQFERYCTRCHNEGIKSGALDLGALSGQTIRQNAAVWETIVRRLLARRDPPAGAPRPDAVTYRTLISGLRAALDAAYAADPSLNGAERADDRELAARLAGLIWNDAPDASLLDDARRGHLHDSAVLNRQVVRMLGDSRSSGLVDTFFAEWLSLDRLKAAERNSAQPHWLDAELVQAMDTETRLFLQSQLRDDRDAVELWTANYTYVNERLARHYGLAGVTGREFRRITWPDQARAGLLGQGGILTMLSFPGRTSPTARGKYVLERFLGISAPSPPANVPPLPNRAAGRDGTMRERMDAHKVNPSCANCHALFDPMGLALENFDATGAWRTMDATASIEASGSFVDGTHFNGPAELRAGLLQYREAYDTSVTQQLLAYALNRKGRSGRVHDFEMPVVRRIVRDAAANGHSWSAILTGIAASGPFQMKTIVP